MSSPKNNFLAQLESLNKDEKVSYYEVLAHQLTVSIRGIWADEELSPNQKLEGMKWANEIMHRVVAKIHVERLEKHEWPEADMIDTFKHYTNLAPYIKDHVAWAVEESYKIMKIETKSLR